MGHAQDMRDGLHLAPVAEREAGQQRPHVHGKRDDAHDRGQHERGARQRAPRPGSPLDHPAVTIRVARSSMTIVSSAFAPAMDGFQAKAMPDSMGVGSSGKATRSRG